MIHILRRIGIDDFVVGRIVSDKIEHNDAELGTVLTELLSVESYRKDSNRKYVGTFLDKIKNKLCFPFSLKTGVSADFELYQYEVVV